MDRRKRRIPKRQPDSGAQDSDSTSDSDLDSQESDDEPRSLGQRKNRSSMKLRGSFGGGSGDPPSLIHNSWKYRSDADQMRLNTVGREILTARERAGGCIQYIKWNRFIRSHFAGENEYYRIYLAPREHIPQEELEPYKTRISDWWVSPIALDTLGYKYKQLRNAGIFDIQGNISFVSSPFSFR